MTEPLNLAALLPIQHAPIMDLVKSAGIDVTPWHTNKEGGLTEPGRNTYYVNQWSFGGGAESEPLAFNIHHKNLQMVDGLIFCDDNKRKSEHKAREFDKRIEFAYEKDLQVRVIIIDKPNARKNTNRILDDASWSVESYDSEGNFRLVRGTIKTVRNKYFDQFSISESTVRIDTSGSKFFRSNDVRDAVLRRAGGICEHCGSPGFLMENGGVYLETHHVIPLSENGADLPNNVVAICANDHRKAHHSVERKEIQKDLLTKLALF